MLFSPRTKTWRQPGKLICADARRRSKRRSGCGGAQSLRPDRSGRRAALYRCDRCPRTARAHCFIGTLSTISVFALAWALFGSPVVLLLMAGTILPRLHACTGRLLCRFGTLSLITFVFGATLIGVSIDYSSHWFALKTAGESAQSAPPPIAGALLSAALSTAAAYCTLALTPLPGLRQMAVLAACGVVGTLFTVLTVLPRLERWVALKTRRG